jgi:hypothetical protein
VQGVEFVNAGIKSNVKGGGQECPPHTYVGRHWRREPCAGDDLHSATHEPRHRQTGFNWESGKREEENRAADSGNRLQVFDQNQADATCRFCWKHSRQNTGRPCVGLNGTVVSLPHSEQVVRVSTLAKLPF